MKSKIEVRKFAVEKAVMIMGTGTADKDVVAKAKEIESYVIGEAVLPETYDESSTLMGVMDSALDALGVKGTKNNK